MFSLEIRRNAWHWIICLEDTRRVCSRTKNLSLPAVSVFSMVKHSEIRENMDKLRGKIVLDCHNIIDLPGVYHI